MKFKSTALGVGNTFDFRFSLTNHILRQLADGVNPLREEFSERARLPGVDQFNFGQ